jgi:hypothetical protein
MALTGATLTRPHVDVDRIGENAREASEYLLRSVERCGR